MDLGEEVDTDDLIGLSGQGTVRHLEPRAKKDGEGFWFNVELDELFPAAMGDRSHWPTPTPSADPWAYAGGASEEPPF